MLLSRDFRPVQEPLLFTLNKLKRPLMRQSQRENKTERGRKKDMHSECQTIVSNSTCYGNHSPLTKYQFINLFCSVILVLMFSAQITGHKFLSKKKMTGFSAFFFCSFHKTVICSIRLTIYTVLLLLIKTSKDCFYLSIYL